MAGFAWLAVRQAQEAMKHGRLEEALRLLNQPHAQEHRGAAALTTKLARAFTARAQASCGKTTPKPPGATCSRPSICRRMRRTRSGCAKP